MYGQSTGTSGRNTGAGKREACRTEPVCDSPFAGSAWRDVYKRQVYSVIDSRYRSGKPLIATTNLTLEELQRVPQSHRDLEPFRQADGGADEAVQYSPSQCGAPLLPVSYTHLDVYKRQVPKCMLRRWRGMKKRLSRSWDSLCC